MLCVLSDLSFDMKKFLFIIFIIILSLIIFRKFFSKDQNLTTSVLGVDVSDWVKGASDTSVTLIEYSDLECPACRAYYPILKQLSIEFGDRARFVYRHFP